MSKKAKGKVQSYQDLRSFFGRTQKFLLKREFENNLFWEVKRLVLKRGVSGWAGNVFLDGRIVLSGMVTPTGYLLLSSGPRHALLRLVAYAKSKKLKIKGVTGPEQSVDCFCELWNGSVASTGREGKSFMIYSISCRRFPPFPLSLALESVGPGSWPRIQAWTMQFARESIPPIQANALLEVTREMMADGNLFLLRKDGVACGMGGFGRSTPNSLVINEVFVPKEMRRQGHAADLISGLVAKAGERKVRNCILFSDFEGPSNLYDSLGFVQVGRFVEKGFR